MYTPRFFNQKYNESDFTNILNIHVAKYSFKRKIPLKKLNLIPLSNALLRS